MEIFLLLLLACFTQAKSWKSEALNLQDQIFLFPTLSDSSYVLLKPSQNQAIERLTICLKFYSNLPNPNFGLFSASSRVHDNEILIFKVVEGYDVSVGDQGVLFLVSGEKTSHQAWEDLCVAWDSATGIIQLWLNKVPLPRKVISKGYRIQRDLVILLGQDQDSYGGSLDEEQAFEGELGDVYMWDTVLSTDQMKSFHRQEDSTLCWIGWI